MEDYAKSLQTENLKLNLEMNAISDKSTEQGKLIDTLRLEKTELQGMVSDTQGLVEVEKKKRNKARLVAAASIVLNVGLIIILGHQLTK